MENKTLAIQLTIHGHSEQGAKMFREKNLLSHVLIIDQLRLYIFIAINLLISDILLCLHITRHCLHC